MSLLLLAEVPEQAASSGAVSGIRKRVSTEEKGYDSTKALHQAVLVSFTLPRFLCPEVWPLRGGERSLPERKLTEVPLGLFEAERFCRKLQLYTYFSWISEKEEEP